MAPSHAGPTCPRLSLVHVRKVLSAPFNRSKCPSQQTAAFSQLQCPLSWSPGLYPDHSPTRGGVSSHLRSDGATPHAEIHTGSLRPSPALPAVRLQLRVSPFLESAPLRHPLIQPGGGVLHVLAPASVRFQLPQLGRDQTSTRGLSCLSPYVQGLRAGSPHPPPGASPPASPPTSLF